MASANCTCVRPRCRRSSANRLPKSEGYAFLAITPAILSPLSTEPGRTVGIQSPVMYTLADGIMTAGRVTRNAFFLLTGFQRKRVFDDRASRDRPRQTINRPGRFGPRAGRDAQAQRQTTGRPLPLPRRPRAEPDRRSEETTLELSWRVRGRR